MSGIFWMNGSSGHLLACFHPKSISLYAPVIKYSVVLQFQLFLQVTCMTYSISLQLNLTSIWILRSKTKSLFLAKLLHAFGKPFVPRTVTNPLIPSRSNFLIQAQFHQLEPKTEKLQEFASSRHTMTITDFIDRDFYLWTPNTIFILFLRFSYFYKKY